MSGKRLLQSQDTKSEAQLIRDEIQAQPVEFYFVFSESHRTYAWWQKPFMLFSRGKFGHVAGFMQAGSGVLHVEPMLKRILLAVETDPDDKNKHLSAYATATTMARCGFVVVKHEFHPKLSGWQLITYCVPSCVSVVKVISGFLSFSLTPKGLYNHLLRSGAELVTIQQ